MRGNWGDVLLSATSAPEEAKREVLTTFLWCSVRGCEEMAYGSAWNHHWEGGQALEQASQGSGHGPKCLGVRERFGKCSETDCLTFRLPCVKSRINDTPGSLPIQDLWVYEKVIDFELLVCCRRTKFVFFYTYWAHNEAWSKPPKLYLQSVYILQRMIHFMLV